MPWWSNILPSNPSAQEASAKAAEARFGAEALALTCLAVELAKSDEDFDGQERQRLSADLSHHFDLSAAAAEELILAAEAIQGHSVENFSFIRKLREGLDAEQRVTVIETLWRLAYADGVLDGAEFSFMRTIPAALGVENHVSEAAKRRAMAALGIKA